MKIFSFKNIMLSVFLVSGFAPLAAMNLNGLFVGRNFFARDPFPTFIREYTTTEVKVGYKNTAEQYELLKNQPEKIKKFFPAMPQNGSVSWHHVLGLNAQASENEIKQAYKKLSLKVHPDKGGDAAVFNIVKHAQQEGLGDFADRYRVFYQKTTHSVYGKETPLYFPARDYRGETCERTTTADPVEIPQVGFADILDEKDKQTLLQHDELIAKCKRMYFGQGVTLAMMLAGFFLYKHFKNEKQDSWIKRNWLVKKVCLQGQKIQEKYPRLSEAAPWMMGGAALFGLAIKNRRAILDLMRLNGANARIHVTPISGGANESPIDVRIFQAKKTWEQNEVRGFNRCTVRYTETSDPIGYMAAKEEYKQFEPLRRTRLHVLLTMMFGGMGLGMMARGAMILDRRKLNEQEESELREYEELLRRAVNEKKKTGLVTS